MTDLNNACPCPRCLEPMKVSMPIWVEPGAEHIDVGAIDWESGNKKDSEKWYCEKCESHHMPIDNEDAEAMKATQKNARFWIWTDGGWVKLTLKPGQTLEHHTGGPHDEGWSYTVEHWEHEGDRVARRSSNESLCCDGRTASHYENSCDIDQLAAKEAHHWDNEPALPFQVPNWEDGEASQRDHNAEAAGY